MKEKFPENFFWGSATSSHQVEGDNFNNDWWEWEESGHTPSSGKACDHYNLFEEDFTIAKDLSHNMHRFSLEWSRLEKEEGVWDKFEWNHYSEVINTLINLNIKPMVTLNHFTVPQWLSHIGSWKNPDSVGYFTRFAVKAMEEFGDRVEYWITINEPIVLAFQGYVLGIWPPYEDRMESSLMVIKHMLKAHSEAYKRMYETAATGYNMKKPRIGLAKAVTAFHPFSPHSFRDRTCTFLRSNFYNHSFVKSIIKGKIDFPALDPEPLAVKNGVDFIGLNYYSRHFIKYVKPFWHNWYGDQADSRERKDFGETNSLGWEIYPKGLYEVVKSFSRYGLPIIITENGTCTEDDSVRQKFIKSHLSYLLKAIKEGCPVEGYLYWSLLDNFEWAEGYKPRFGLVHVDYETQERTVKPSAKYLSQVIRTGLV